MVLCCRNGLGDCLNDEPQPSQYKYKNVLPGVVYDADAQCQFSHPGSSVCRMNQHEFCKMLLCKPSPSADSCLGNQEPPADGTKCGENKVKTLNNLHLEVHQFKIEISCVTNICLQWCFHGQCVQIGERPAAINGGWGEWGAYSKCSRSCGGGVSTAERDCVNPVPLFLGKFCLGERKKVKICNTTVSTRYYLLKIFKLSPKATDTFHPSGKHPEAIC